MDKTTHFQANELKMVLDDDSWAVFESSLRVERVVRRLQYVPEDELASNRPDDNLTSMGDAAKASSLDSALSTLHRCAIPIAARAFCAGCRAVGRGE